MSKAFQASQETNIEENQILEISDPYDLEAYVERNDPSEECEFEVENLFKPRDVLKSLAEAYESGEVVFSDKEIAKSVEMFSDEKIRGGGRGYSSVFKALDDVEMYLDRLVEKGALEKISAIAYRSDAGYCSGDFYLMKERVK